MQALVTPIIAKVWVKESQEIIKLKYNLLLKKKVTEICV